MGSSHDDNDEDDDLATADCPSCDGEAFSMGKLGNRGHFRCRSCGYTFPAPAMSPFRSDGSGNAYEDMERVRRDRPFVTGPLLGIELAIAERVHRNEKEERPPSRKKRFT